MECVPFVWGYSGPLIFIVLPVAESSFYFVLSIFIFIFILTKRSGVDVLLPNSPHSNTFKRERKRKVVDKMDEVGVHLYVVVLTAKFLCTSEVSSNCFIHD